LFEIDSRFKFDIVVAQQKPSQPSIYCAFYLHDPSWLFSQERVTSQLEYDMSFIRLTGGSRLVLTECRSQDQVNVLRPLLSVADTSVERFFDSHGIDLSIGVEVHRHPEIATPLVTNSIPGDAIPLLEGRHFWQHIGRTSEELRYAARVTQLLSTGYW